VIARGRRVAVSAASGRLGGGASRVLDRALPRRRGVLTILTYHRVDEPSARPDLMPSLISATPDGFAAQMAMVSREFDPVALPDVLDALDDPRRLPGRAVLVTFDDGYRSVLDHALPILERHGIPAAVFVTTQAVFESRHFWFDVLARREGEAAVDRAKALPYPEWQALRDPISTAAAPDETHRPMTRDELAELAASPLIEIGGHTERHPVLAMAPLEEQRREICGCRATLQQALAKSIASFAYPFGQLADHYQPETTSIVREAGFDVAFTTQPSFVTAAGNFYEVPRFLMLDSVDDVELAHRLVHSWRAVGEIA